jgi:hypothetical protein
MIPQRQTGARWRARETRGVMLNPRQVPSEGKRSPSSKSASLHKGFSTFYCGLALRNGESPVRERAFNPYKKMLQVSYMAEHAVLPLHYTGNRSASIIAGGAMI